MVRYSPALLFVPSLVLGCFILIFESASVGACEKDSLKIVPFTGLRTPVAFTFVPLHDTVREYMTVDTVLTCPDCWELMDYTLPTDTLPGQAKRCGKMSVTSPNHIESQPPDTTYITTWHLKAQRWFTPGELEVFDAWLLKQMPCEVTGHDWYATGLGSWSSSGRGESQYRCNKCDAGEQRDD